MYCSQSSAALAVQGSLNSQIGNLELINSNPFFSSDSTSKRSLIKTKLIAISLAVTLGYFGVHRLYLGTKPIVPIAYTLTLGGGGFILPLIDIFYIIASKDINQIVNNDYVFMWNKKIKG